MLLAGLQFNRASIQAISQWVSSFQPRRTVDICDKNASQTAPGLNPYRNVLSATNINAMQALATVMRTGTLLVQGAIARDREIVPGNLFKTAGVESAPMTGENTADSQSDDKPLDFSKIQKDYQVPKYPIVLCHGFSGFDTLIYIPAVKFSFDISPFMNESEKKQKKNDALYQGLEEDDQELDREHKLKPDKDVDDDGGGIGLFEYWHGIKEALEQHGCRVLVAKVPPFAAIETRAAALDTFITGKATEWQKKHNTTQKVKINLVAHSLGGLDCRYLISKLEKQNYEVVSLTTISTPHRGTYAADFATEHMPQSVIDGYFPSLRQMTRAYSRKMNRELPNDPKVQYFSFGGAAHLIPADMYYIPWYIIGQKEGPNDGMVSLRSCRWGKYMGHIEGVDHKDLINWMGGVNWLKQALGAEVSFNPLAFYLSIADNLARNGL